MNEYLKPCPSCGGKNIAVLRLSVSRNDDLTNVLCAPKDGGCGLGISRPSRADAIAAWNLRTPVSEPGPWIDWHGGDRPPVPADEIVDIKLYDGGIQSATNAGEWDWTKGVGRETAIVAYRVSAACAIPTKIALDAERYRKWVSYSQFPKERADEILDRISINEFAAGTEPLDPLPEGWRLDGTLIYRVAGDPHPENCDEIRVTLAEGSRDEHARSRLAAQLFALRKGAPRGAITEDWVNRCLDVAHNWADQAYESGKGKPHQSLADARRALRHLLMEALAGGAGSTVSQRATAPTSGEISFRDWYIGLSPQWRKVVDAVDPIFAAAPATAADPRVDDLSMLVKQLVHSLRKAAPENALAGRALDYLRRKGILGSPLRMEGNGGLESDAAAGQGEAA